MVAPRRVIARPTDAEQRQRLLEISRSRTEPTNRVERARIILAYLHDPSAYRVARTIRVTQQTVTRCLERAAVSPTLEMLALVKHTCGMIEEGFAPLDPQRAHESLAVERCAEILSALKPSYIHHPRTKKLIQRVLNAFGCSSEKTYQDVPRLRCAFPKDYLTTGIA
jgi:hypothetical protein